MSLLFIALAAVVVGNGDQGRAPPVNQLAKVRELIGRLDGVNSIRTTKLPNGALRVRLCREKGTAVPLVWRDGLQQADHTYWGSDLSFVLSQTRGSIRLDGLNNVVTPVSGPFRTRQTQITSLSLHVDDNGRPYYISTNCFRGPLGRLRCRENVLTECNLPTDSLLKELKQPGALAKLQEQLKAVQGLDEINIVRKGAGVIEVSLKGVKLGKVALNQKTALYTVEAAEVADEVSFRVTDDGKEIKVDNIKGVTIHVEALFQKIKVDLKSVVLSTGDDGKLAASAEVSSPTDAGKTLVVPVSLKDLPLDLGGGK